MAGEKSVNRIRELREARGWSQEALAQRCIPKTTQPQIDRLEKGVRQLTYTWMSTLAEALGVPVSDFFPGVDKPTPSGSQRVVAVSSQGSVRFPRETQGSFPWPKDLRVLGYVKAGQVGYYPDNGETLEMTERPPSLIGVPDAYAVYIDDVSMVPALKPGYLAWVHPRKPAIPGDNVIVQLHDGQAFVKELVRRTEKQVICKQWNPPEEVRYAVADVKAVHLVDGAKFGR